MTGDEVGRARLADTLLRREKNPEPEDPETEAPGERRRVETQSGSSRTCGTGDAHGGSGCPGHGG